MKNRFKAFISGEMLMSGVVFLTGGIKVLGALFIICSVLVYLTAALEENKQ